jgi:prepilin-type N-terminal cleavage/methylation domain-containing protein
MHAMPRGYSLIEVLVATTLLVIVMAMAVPMVLYSAEYSRVAGAARYLAARIAMVRMEALKRSTYVALRFEHEDGHYRFSTYIDGNGNGVRGSEVARQIDFPLARAEQLEDHFPGVTFGFSDDVLPVTSDEALVGGDPIRIGRSDFLSFSPVGSATSGTLYVRGQGRQQFAVRIFGVTGRVSVLRFDFQNRRWTGL